MKQNCMNKAIAAVVLFACFGLPAGWHSLLAKQCAKHRRLIGYNRTRDLTDSPEDLLSLRDTGCKQPPPP
jgi:hypothetical protein